MQICFIDNRPEYARFIEKETGWSVTPVCNEAELADAIAQPFDAWFIGLSINWDNHFYTSFYGFEIVRILRVEHKITVPIICFSFMPEYWFEKEQIKDSNILNWFGHQYLQLPFTGSETKKAVKNSDLPLTEFHLAELAYACYTPLGIIEEQFHSLSNKTNEPKDVFKEAAEKSLEIIKKQVSVADYAYIESVFRNLTAKAENSKDLKTTTVETHLELELTQPTNADELTKKDVTHAKENIQKLFREKQQVVPFTTEPLPWYVLFVDDEAHIRDQIETRLKLYGLNCITAESHKEACEILNNDAKGEWFTEKRKMPANSITVLISDLRFIENKRVAYNQGYQLLSDVYHQNFKGSNKQFNYGLLSLFLLTSNSGALERLMNTRSPFKTFYYDKDILDIEKVFARFAMQVFEEGNIVFETLHQNPSNLTWTDGSSRIAPSLEFYYRQHRMSENYHDKEKNINKQAQAYTQNALQVITGVISNTGKQLKLSTALNKDSAKAMDIFYNILIGRRIALALASERNKITPDIVTCLLKEGSIPKYYKPDHKLFTTFLALPTNISDEIPDHLLVEEKTWLQINNYL